MAKHILIPNEQKYLERYGISLQDRWSAMNEKDRIRTLGDAAAVDNKGLQDSVDFAEENILRIVIGFGGRRCLEKITGNALPTLRAVVWEPDEALFLAYCTEADLSDIISDERISIVIGNDIEFLEKALRENVSDNNTFHNKVMAVGKYAVPDSVYIHELETVLGKVADEVTFDGCARKAFNNLPCNNLLYTIRTLDNNFIVSQFLNAVPTRDIPVIIVSAGPSLMKNCMELRRAGNRAIVIAVSHAMKTLNSFGIRPDMVAVTDASATDFIGSDNEHKHTLLCSVYADRHCREGYDGHIIYHGFPMVNHLFMCDRSVTEQYTELDTGSVATDVFSTFMEAGFRTLILCGQDLAYDTNGYTHTGEQRENSVFEKNELFSETDGIYGGKVKTRDDWERMRAFFEKKIGEKPDVQVIDATEGGALIHGTEIMSLTDAIDSFCKDEYPVSEWITGLKKGDENEKRYIDSWFDTEKDRLKRISNFLDEAVRLNTSIREVWNEPENWDDGFNAECKRYDVLYSQIMEGNSGDLLRLYCVENIQEYIENALAVEGDENTLKRMEMECRLFTLMNDKAAELKGYIDELCTKWK